MRISLALDSTSEACSVALRHSSDSGSGSNILQRYEHAPRRHGELLLGWIAELLAEAGASRSQLDGIWVSNGPGSFTSLRLGFSLATAMAFALAIPVVPVSSLRLLAGRANFVYTAENPATDKDCQYVLAALDARLGEVYCGWFQRDLHGLRALQPEQLLRPEALAWPPAVNAGNACALGNGLLVQEHALLQRALAAGICCRADCWPQASDLFGLAEIGQGVAAWAAELCYLRNKVADKPAGSA